MCTFFQQAQYCGKHEWGGFEISLGEGHALIEFVYRHESRRKAGLEGWATRAWDPVSGVISPRRKPLSDVCGLWVRVIHILLAWCTVEEFIVSRVSFAVGLVPQPDNRVAKERVHVGRFWNAEFIPTVSARHPHFTGFSTLLGSNSKS